MVVSGLFCPESQRMFPGKFAKKIQVGNRGREAEKEQPPAAGEHEKGKWVYRPPVKVRQGLKKSFFMVVPRPVGRATLNQRKNMLKAKAAPVIQLLPPKPMKN